MSIRNWKRGALIGVFIALFLPLTSARAHSDFDGPRQSFTHMVGPYTLVVTLEMAGVVPGPVFVDIVPQTALGDVTLQLRAVPRGQPFSGAPFAEAQPTDDSNRLYYT